MRDFSFESIFRGVCTEKSKCFALDEALFLPLKDGNLRSACTEIFALASMSLSERPFLYDIMGSSLKI